MSRAITTSLAVAALLWGSAASADPASAIRAYDAGLYSMAASEFRREADAGNAEAQYRLGTMYADGVWVSHDHGKAAEWFDKAARQGHQAAQETLRTFGRR
jgi:TPR repeat protein